jgi:FMN phosphatase YigB (HAD superfamily)
LPHREIEPSILGLIHTFISRVDGSVVFRLKSITMLKAILFDLDNTLILFDEDRFYQGYFQRMEKLFVDIIPPDKFVGRLISATRTMVQNNGEMTNAEYFIKAFAQGYKDQQDELWDRFLYFYETEYDKLDVNITLPNHLYKTMDNIVRTGLTLVLASNPIFPLNVQMKRLAWANLDHLPFELFTHIENMSFCKPRIEYYLEICQKIDLPPEACLMVGNDPVNDMVAAHTGMKTYLTDDSKGAGRVRIDTDKILERLQLEEIPEPDFKGPFSKVPGAVQRCTE